MRNSDMARDYAMGKTLRYRKGQVRTARQRTLQATTIMQINISIDRQRGYILSKYVFGWCIVRKDKKINGCAGYNKDTEYFGSTIPC
jgi:hypothetical protein